ncbi:hypothetical protein HDU76_011966, partial [Blyttiomyces sp. JEL0837]
MMFWKDESKDTLLFASPRQSVGDQTESLPSEFVTLPVIPSLDIATTSAHQSQYQSLPIPVVEKGGLVGVNSGVAGGDIVDREETERGRQQQMLKWDFENHEKHFERSHSVNSDRSTGAVTILYVGKEDDKRLSESPEELDRLTEMVERMVLRDPPQTDVKNSPPLSNKLPAVPEPISKAELDTVSTSALQQFPSIPAPEFDEGNEHDQDFNGDHDIRNSDDENENQQRQIPPADSPMNQETKDYYERVIWSDNRLRSSSK